MQSFRRFLGVNIIACCLLSMPTEARVISSEDASGETMCGNSVPRSVIHRGISEYDNRGIEHRRFDRVPSEENQEYLRALKELRLVRDRETARLRGQIKAVMDEWRRLRTRFSVLQSLVAQEERRGAQPSASLLDDLEKTDREFGDVANFVFEKEDEIRILEQQYNILKRHLQRRSAEHPWPKFEPFRAVSATTARRDLPQVDHLL
jgi:hypothetical protein